MNDSNDDRFDRMAAGLATEIAPERDLWPGIVARLDDNDGEAGGAWQWPSFAQAAAVVLLVAGSSGITWLATKDDRGPEFVIAPELLFEQTSFARYDLGPGFKDARTKLSSQLDDELAKLSPEARAEVEENLVAIRTAIAEINAALEAEPDNVLLQELLLRTYRDELTVMRRVGGLTQDVTARNYAGRTDI
jgi:hypothetical protein